MGLLIVVFALANIAYSASVEKTDDSGKRSDSYIDALQKNRDEEIVSNREWFEFI